MPTGTGFKPFHVSDMTADKLNYNGYGVYKSVAGGLATTNIDTSFANDDMLLTGMQIFTKTSSFGDTLNLLVLDSASGLYTGTPNAVLNQFVTNWYTRDDQQIQIDKDLEYPAKILAGMVVRAQYVNTTLNAVKIAINYDFHKVLI